MSTFCLPSFGLQWAGSLLLDICDLVEERSRGKMNTKPGKFVLTISIEKILGEHRRRVILADPAGLRKPHRERSIQVRSCRIKASFRGGRLGQSASRNGQVTPAAGGPALRSCLTYGFPTLSWPELIHSHLIQLPKFSLMLFLLLSLNYWLSSRVTWMLFYYYRFKL